MAELPEPLLTFYWTATGYDYVSSEKVRVPLWEQTDEKAGMHSYKEEASGFAGAWSCWGNNCNISIDGTTVYWEGGGCDSVCVDGKAITLQISEQTPHAAGYGAKPGDMWEGQIDDGRLVWRCGEEEMQIWVQDETLCSLLGNPSSGGDLDEEAIRFIKKGSLQEKFVDKGYLKSHICPRGHTVQAYFVDKLAPPKCLQCDMGLADLPFSEGDDQPFYFFCQECEWVGHRKCASFGRVEWTMNLDLYGKLLKCLDCNYPNAGQIQEAIEASKAAEKEWEDYDDEPYWICEVCSSGPNDLDSTVCQISTECDGTRPLNVLIWTEKGSASLKDKPAMYESLCKPNAGDFFDTHGIVDDVDELSVRDLLGHKHIKHNKDAEQPCTAHIDVAEHVLEQIFQIDASAFLPYFVLYYRNKYINRGEVVWSGVWRNPFASLGKSAAECLQPLDTSRWHQPSAEMHTAAANGCGGDPYMDALMGGSPDEVQELFKKPRDLLRWYMDPVEFGHMSSLHVAFDRGDVDILKHLLQLSPKHFMQMITMSSGLGDSIKSRWTPWQRAIMRARRDAIKWMCESGVITDALFTACHHNGTHPSSPSYAAFTALEVARAVEGSGQISDGVWGWSSTPSGTSEDLKQIIEILQQWHGLPVEEKRARSENCFAEILCNQVLVNLNISQPREDGLVTVCCTNIAGEELAVINTKAESTVEQFRSELAKVISKVNACLQLVDAQGELLCDGARLVPVGQKSCANPATAAMGGYSAT